MSPASSGCEAGFQQNYGAKMITKGKRPEQPTPEQDEKVLADHRAGEPVDDATLDAIGNRQMTRARQRRSSMTPGR